MGFKLKKMVFSCNRSNKNFKSSLRDITKVIIAKVLYLYKQGKKSKALKLRKTISRPTGLHEIFITSVTWKHDFL